MQHARVEATIRHVGIVGVEQAFCAEEDFVPGAGQLAYAEGSEVDCGDEWDDVSTEFGQVAFVK